MRDLSPKRWLLAVLMLLTPWVVSAAGLGRLTVLSALGQPFRAEIDLVSVQKEELATLAVRLASPDAYRQANLQYDSTVAGLALSIEKRPDGRPYIRIISARPVNEFVVDILIDLSWASGRLMREYRALLDPPGLEAAPVAAVEPRPAAAPQPLAAPVRDKPAASGNYGPVQRGETLSKIARGVKPDGVSVEQMLVGLFRSNPEAFINKNMNLVRSGRILRVPEKEEVAAIPQQEAVKEYRAQVADWNAYRKKLADVAAVAPEARAAASGRITARVEDKAAPAAAKDVVRLSKGEPPSDKAGTKDGVPPSAKERIRSLEEEIIARERALNEANERIAQLEKTIKDMQRLLEIKSPGMAAVQEKAETAAKPEPGKPEPKPAETPLAKAKPEPPKPKPVAKVASSPPPSEPSLLDILLDPLYLSSAGGVLVLAALGYWLVGRRRVAEEGGELAQLAPTLGKLVATPSGPAAAATTAAVSAAAAVAAAPAADVDPLEEARIYITHGRDTQAEAILKEALAKEPSREDVQVKLLEIYAARKDKPTFARYAGDFQKLTGGQGESWLRVAAMGFALDAANPLYAAGKGATSAAPLAEETPAVDLDLDLTGPAAEPTATDITLEADVARAAAEPAAEKPAAPLMPDFNLEVPPAAQTQPDVALDARPSEPAALDFNIELPKIEIPGTGAAAGAAAPATQKQEEEAGLKFDLGNIDLDLDDKSQGAAAAEGKDAHWYDVQTKFDLAKAYEEMGDKAGAKEILQEVIKEGDAEQQTQAKLLLTSLG